MIPKPDAGHDAVDVQTDPGTWFTDLVNDAAAAGPGDVYIEVRGPRIDQPGALLAWSRTVEGSDSYASLTHRHVPAHLAADPQSTCDAILRLVGLLVDVPDAQSAERQMTVDGESIEVRMVHTPSQTGCRLALRMSPAHRPVAV